MTSNPTIQYLLSFDTCLPSRIWCGCPGVTSWETSKLAGVNSVLPSVPILMTHDDDDDDNDCDNMYKMILMVVMPMMMVMIMKITMVIQMLRM